MMLSKNYIDSLSTKSTDYGRPVRKSPSLHGRKSNPNPKFIGTAEAYFVCHIGPKFQVSLIYAFIGCPLSVMSCMCCVFDFELEGYTISLWIFFCTFLFYKNLAFQFFLVSCVQFSKKNIFPANATLEFSMRISTFDFCRIDAWRKHSL